MTIESSETLTGIVKIIKDAPTTIIFVRKCIKAVIIYIAKIQKFVKTGTVMEQLISKIDPTILRRR